MVQKLDLVLNLYIFKYPETNNVFGEIFKSWASFYAKPC